MPFRLREDARRWFSELERKTPTNTMFDLYYYCLMVGLASGRSSDLSTLEVSAPEIVGDFIQEYKPAQRLLIGLLVVAEVRKRGIDLAEKAAVREIFRDLVTPDTSTKLTDEGMRCFNAYASGGYEFLTELRDEKPASPEQFLRDFVGLMEVAVETGDEHG